MAYWPKYGQVNYATHSYAFNTTWFNKTLIETINSSDILLKNLDKLLEESVTSTDAALLKDIQKTFTEIQVMNDIVTKNITEKVLTETLRIQHWLI